MIDKKNFEKTVCQLVRDCTRCVYCNNGKAFPWFGENPKIIIVGEAPHTDEIAQGTFFVGRSGKLLFDVLHEKAGISRNDTIILNSVFCMPTKEHGKSIGKPTKECIDKCFLSSTNLLYKIKNLYNIDKVLVLGTYSRYVFKKILGGIMSDCGRTERLRFRVDDSSMKLFYCIHPSSCFYNPKNMSLFKETIEKFFNFPAGKSPSVRKGMKGGTF